MGLRYDPSVQDFVRTLPPGPKKAVRQAITRLGQDPRDDGLDLKMLDHVGPEPLYRCTVGAYRIVYAVRPGHTYIHRVLHRRDGYGWLERL